MFAYPLNKLFTRFMENNPWGDNLGNQISENLATYPSLTPAPKRRSFKYWGRIIALCLGGLLIIFGLFFAYKIFSAGDKIFVGKGGNSIISQIKNLIIPDKKNALTDQTERVNILLIGVRGTDQTKDQGGGPYLADTIIVMSVKPKTHEVAMLSIPRDLWVNIDGYGQAKINAAYAYGIKDDAQEGGARLLSKTVEEVTGVALDYYVVADFVGFEKIVDIVGGIDLNVENSFKDYFYPAWNYEFQTISFAAGQQHMDGDKALKFVRSRHGTNSEGSDFARAKRQQKVLVALKDKVFSISTILNPIKLTKLVDSMGNHLITNLELVEAREFLDIAKNIDTQKIHNIVLENNTNGLLVASRSENGASILVPKDGDFSEIKNLAQNIFETSTDKKTLPAQTEQVDNSVKVQIRNGTAVPGLAGKTAIELKEAGYEIVGILNADSKDYEKTVIYDNTEGKNAEALQDLKEKLDANVAAGRSFFLDKSEEGRGDAADFVIILGADKKI